MVRRSLNFIIQNIEAPILPLSHRSSRRYADRLDSSPERRQNHRVLSVVSSLLTGLFASGGVVF